MPCELVAAFGFVSLADGEVLATVSAIDVGDTHSALALRTRRSELEAALWAKVHAWDNAGGALRARGEQWLPKQKIEHQADSAGHKDDQRRPQRQVHAAPFGVARHIADHQRINR